MAARRAASLVPCTSPSAVKPNKLVIPAPTSAAIAVVANKIPITSTLIFPREVVWCSFTTALKIDIKISGMITICNSCT